MHHKDGRVSLMTEIIKFIRTIKLYVWEDYFTNKIESIKINFNLLLYYIALFYLTLYLIFKLLGVMR